MNIRDRMARLLRDASEGAKAIEFEERWWTWGQMRSTGLALDDLLTTAGLGPATRIGVVVENRPEHVAVLAAVVGTGRCLVTFSRLQPADRLAADITHSEVPIVIAATEVFDAPGVLAAATRTGMAVALEPDGTVRHVGGHRRSDASGNPSTLIEMLTSGTTGPPKRVRLSTEQVDTSLISGGQEAKQGAQLTDATSLIYTPLVHIGGLWGTLACLYSGRRLVLLPKFSVAAWVGGVERHRLLSAGLVPPAMRMVLDAEVPSERLASLRAVTSGTAPCPASLADAFTRRYDIPVLTVYGATEFAGAVAGWTLRLHRQWWDRKADSVGRAFPGVELRVTNEDGAEVPAGQRGWLEIRTRQSSEGERTWVRTADLASIDADGFLWIKGRGDDSIIRGGFKVQPETVKEALEEHPAVREAAVAGLPDKRLGSVPVAAVQLERGVAPPELDELIALCHRQLTPYEVPAHVVIVDELPRTPSSKVSRVDLLDLISSKIAQ